MTVVVAFVSRKGGVGKSTFARALAAVAARRGLVTTLADLDKDQKTSSRWQRLRKRTRSFRSSTVEAYGNIDAAIASEPDADLLIADAPGNAPELTMEIASVAHFVVQPSGACFDDLQPAVELIYQLKAAGIPKSRLYVALSRMLDPDEEEAARAYIEVADFSVLPGAVVEPAGIREASQPRLGLHRKSRRGSRRFGGRCPQRPADEDDLQALLAATAARKRRGRITVELTAANSALRAAKTAPQPGVARAVTACSRLANSQNLYLNSVQTVRPIPSLRPSSPSDRAPLLLLRKRLIPAPHDIAATPETSPY